MKIMRDINQIQRKHVRFPAYSDDTGVKIQSKKYHTPFSNDENWILTEEKNIPLTKASQTNKKGARLRPSKKDIQEKAGLTIQEQNELKEHKKHLPNYGFKKEKKAKNSAFKKPSFKQNFQSVKQKDKKSSYFASEHVPASALSKERNNKKEVMNALKKPAEDYVLFDTDVTSPREKKWRQGQ
ncbi:hypothetical protein GCM10025885_05340 [Tetragenococcus osmophilus]|uniref:Uncharacterized protein n=2 Tax=Tetragenococcus osmophilus TaxID=526944 RepID=A0AA38CXI1_9ENTE|nr:hypothetical protein GCM10025885_05340 [Tetragenococcus osmophilus]